MRKKMVMNTSLSDLSS